MPPLSYRRGRVFLSQGRNPPILNAPPVIGWLAGGNLLVHIGRLALSPDADTTLIWRYAFVAARILDPAAWSRTPGQLLASPVTYAFLHADLTHVLINVVLLLAFGTVVARRMGTLAFLTLYLLSAVAAALTWAAMNPGSPAPLIGASGAVSGMVGAVGAISLKPGRHPLPPLHRRGTALAFVLIWLAANLLAGFLRPEFLGISGGAIAWEAHLGGFAAGFLLIRFFDRHGRRPLGT